MEERKDSIFASATRYFFVFAHPDDEVYSCISISNLLQDGKTVHVLYVTSGDYRGAEIAVVREKEALASMQVIGVPAANVRFLRIPERELMKKIREVREGIFTLAQNLGVECLVSHDFEGGHNGHDAISFCTSHSAQSLGILFYVFPAYHAWPEKRVWNRFVFPREATYVHLLLPEEKTKKEGVVRAHTTQSVFFETLKAGDQEGLFLLREVLRPGGKPEGYFAPPTSPVGYEYPGSSIRFEDFKKSITVV